MKARAERVGLLVCCGGDVIKAVGIFRDVLQRSTSSCDRFEIRLLVCFVQCLRVLAA